jgi:xanthomonalisin
MSGLALSILATLCAGGFGTAAGAVNVSASPMLKPVATATALRHGDAVVGTLSATHSVHVEVALKLRNRQQLDTFNHAIMVPNAVMARQTLTQEEISANHLPTENDAQRVVNFLVGAGFSNVQVAPNRMLVSADAPAAVAQSAFNTQLVQVFTHDGRDAFANNSPVQIPVELDDVVLSVIGLQSVHQAHTMLRYAVNPQAITGHNPTEFSSIYGGSGQPTAAGVTVGIITQGSLTNVKNDLNTFTANNGLATVTTQTVQTGSTSTDTSGDGEWDLDSQDIVGMGGGQVGKIIFYNIPTLANTNLTADINTAVSANAAKIINVSLGECETSAQGDGSAAAQDQAFATAVAQGQTFSVSTGDSGADECGDGGVTPSWPAASQYVIAVAGTKLDASTTTWNSEVVWNDLPSNGATGGSQSTFEPKPSWQTLWSGARRGVADVAFDASPSSGAKVIVDGASQQIGGTSLAAPIFSGLWARVLAAKGTATGFAGPKIYQLPASAFHDVTSGNNSGSTAAAGYDLASGRGSIILSTALANIGGGTTNQPPTANFSFTTSGLVATFTDSSTDSDGTIASRSWNFGDSSTSTATNPSHTYAAAGTYTVTETVTDNGGATGTTSKSVTVTSTGGGGSVLSNGVAVTGLSGTTGTLSSAYTFTVPAGATNVSIAISGGTGDADLYVKAGSAPTLTSYDCRPYVTGNSETCSGLSAGVTYYVKINAYSTYSGVSLVGNYTTGGGGGGNVLSNGVPVTGLSGTTNTLSADYTLTVPSGKTSVTIKISGGTGDADLYVKLNAAPTLTTYDCRPYVTGNSETCTFTPPSGGGVYHVKLNAYSTYTGVTLTGSYSP